MDAERKRQLADLERRRTVPTRTSLPLEAYAGRYESALYSDLHVTAAAGRLKFQFGDYSGTLEHWENDAFYGHAVIEPFLDWLVKFSLAEDRTVRGLEIVHIGWKDPDERFVFSRAVRN
jgi:hypothetical protein